MVSEHVKVCEHAIVLDEPASNRDVNSGAHREPNVAGSQFLNQILVVQVDSDQLDLSADYLLLLFVFLGIGEGGLVFDCVQEVSQKRF